ncbi:MgtC/SapB family protein [Xanthomonas massiliensis]|jgi:putative Mg2+ transporter-C (MgtC) family protein|uniref:MgtC/SapB family protein n=1 Tax=Xanthomonas massiliensis TaxID=1720302 RepID=UPI0008271A57|nr:MgtC/SapB family protein [Xanthomonas massiliensis]
MLSTGEIVLRLLLAALLGAVIGIDRGRLEWAAGLRTHMLVCVGAALGSLVSAYGFLPLAGQPGISLDPSRVASLVVSGIGFVCAGTIMFLQREQVIRGLTTAASLWAVAMIGLAAGAGLYAAAMLATALSWMILALLKPLEMRWLQRTPGNGLRVTLARGSSLAKVEAALSDLHVPVTQIVLERRDDREDTVEVMCPPLLGRKRLLEVADRLGDVEGITSVGLLGAEEPGRPPRG